MPIYKVFTTPKTDEDILTAAEINQIDTNTSLAPSKDGYDAITADWTITGDQTNLDNTVSISGSVPGSAQFNLYNANSTITQAAQSFNLATLTMASSSQLNLDASSSFTLASGEVKTGVTKTIVHSAIEGVATRASWTVENYYLKGGTTGTQAVLSVPSLRQYKGTLTNMTVYYRVAGTTRLARMQAKLTSYSGQVLSGASYVDSALGHPSYGTDISASFPLSVALDGTRSWALTLTEESGGVAQPDSIIYGFSFTITNATRIL